MPLRALLNVRAIRVATYQAVAQQQCDVDFTSDRTLVLRGGKFSNWEGGVRVRPSALMLTQHAAVNARVVVGVRRSLRLCFELG